MTVGLISIIIGVFLLILLKLLSKGEDASGQNKRLHEIDHDELFNEDLENDPSWATLSSNTHHSEDD
jgi:hypothetical protein